MKRIIIAAMLFAATQSHAGRIATGDSWVGADKYQHAAGEAIIGLAAGAYFEDKSTAFAVAMIPGIAKEIYDYRHSDKHSASFKDLAADAVGAAIGVYVGNCIIRHNQILCGWRF